MSLDIPIPNGPCLIMLDFDGTLVPWNISPSATVTVSPELPDLLTSLQQAGHTVVIVTGRSQGVVHRLIAPAHVPIVGLHGAQWPNKPLPARNPLLDTALQQLQQLKKQFPQLCIEDKQVLASGHWGQVPAQQQQQAADAVVEILQMIANQSLAQESQRLSLLGGHNMMELRPDCASKALSAARLLQQHAGLHPIFIGDDLSDEEAFVQLSKLSFPYTTVQVCDRQHVHTTATYRLPGPENVHAFLRQLT